MDDAQHVEQLALVFMDALDLDVQQGICRDVGAGHAGNPADGSFLGHLLDLLPVCLELLIVCMLPELLQA